MRSPAKPSRALLAVVLLGAGGLSACGGSDPKPTASTPADQSAAVNRAKPVEATQAMLKALEKELGRPVFWVGPKDATTYELTRTADGSVYIRYLDKGAPLGDAKPDYVTVGSYPQENPFETVTASSEREGAQVDELADGGLAVANADRPGSIYLAYPGSKVLVEVFAPDPAQARKLVRDGEVRPVSG